MCFWKILPEDHKDILLDFSLNLYNIAFHISKVTWKNELDIWRAWAKKSSQCPVQTAKDADMFI